MFGNFEVADIIAYHFMTIDVRCRRELQSGAIVSERDYVSAFATRVRDRLWEHFECHSQTLRFQAENENGVDGIIVFKHDDKIKVGMFEAKRPQFAYNNHGWDYLSSRHISHFTEQLENQQRWKNVFALWEVFINETPNGHLSPPLQSVGSSCVWQNKAYRFANKKILYPNRWTTRKLKELLEKDGITLYSIIYDIIICKEGKLFSINPKDNTVTVINPRSNDIQMEIPLPELAEGYSNENDPRITAFLQKNNLEAYTFVNLDAKRG